MNDLEFKNKMMLLTRIESPAYIFFNDKFTIMLENEEFRLLVFSKKLNKEVFIPCDISIENKKIVKGDRENILIAEKLDSYRESKEKHRSLGSFMDSI